MDDILIKEYISSILEEAKNQGLFDNLDDLADYLVEHGIVVDESLM
ncbi:MAG: hypothetical protein J6U54_07700 [Clostridiales bacterium]|nr:hypothetical protein [Clostridiales bacterium]